MSNMINVLCKKNIDTVKNIKTLHTGGWGKLPFKMFDKFATSWTLELRYVILNCV